MSIAGTTKPSMLYEEIHNLAVLIILSRLMLAGIEAEAEIAIEYGVVDIVDDVVEELEEGLKREIKVAEKAKRRREENDQNWNEN
jgi:hypothetical protein